MDHGISYDGMQLYFNNARFDGGNCTGPCETWLGVAQKINDSTFAKWPNTDGIMMNVNDSSWKYYAPCITADNKELYYTRIPTGTLTGTSRAEICVAVRNTVTDTFSLPQILISENIVNDMVEASTLTTDKSIMYYHKRVSGVFEIKMRRRLVTSGLDGRMVNRGVRIFPNPVQSSVMLHFDGLPVGEVAVEVMDVSGKVVLKFQTRERNVALEMEGRAAGIYFVKVLAGGQVMAAEKMVVVE